MKQVIKLLVVVVMMAVAAQAFGFGMPSFGGNDKKESGEKVDVKALTTRNATLRIRIHKATIAMANGLIEIQNACGMAAEAAKLEQVRDEALKNPDDVEGTKKLVSEVNNAGTALKKVDFNAKMNKEEGRKRVGKSLLYLGAGSLLDLQAVNDAKNLINDITKAVKVVQAAPMTYGMSAVKDLNAGLDTAKFVAEAIPTQVSTITDLTKGLVKYAQTNKIEVPSAEKQAEESKKMDSDKG